MRCNRFQVVLAIAAVAMAALVFTTAPTHAADRYSSGTKAWDTSTDNWGNAPGVYTGSTWNNAPPDSAFLEGTAGTVTLGEAISIQDMTVSVANYTIAGSDTLTFGAGGTITNTGGAATLSSGISGSPNVRTTKDLTFSSTSANMALGTITPNEIHLRFESSTTGNSLAGSTYSRRNKLHFNGSGTWTVGDVYGGEFYIRDGNLIANGELTSNYRYIYLYDPATLHYNNPGAVASQGRFRLSGGSLDNSSGAAITTSTYNPSQEWLADWTFIGSNGTASDLNLGTGAVTMNAGRQVTVQNAAATLTVGGAIGDGGNAYGLTKAGDGTLELTGNSTYMGDTTVSAGTLSITQPYLSDLSSVSVAAGAIMDLAFTGTDDVFALSLGGTPVAPGSTAGALGSGADVESALLTGSGLLNVPVPTALDGVRLWDGGTTNIGSNGDGFSDGGSGTWSTSIQNWDAGAGVPHESWNNAAPDDMAVFDGPSGTVTLAEDIDLGDLVFEATAGTGYTITGNTLNFAAGSTITANVKDVTIASGITGAPTVSANQAGNDRLTFAPTAASVTLGAISGSGLIEFGGTTSGNSIASMGGNKGRWNGSGTWTLNGNAFAYEHWINSGNLIIGPSGSIKSNNRALRLESAATLHYNNPAAVQDVGHGSYTWEIRGSVDNTSGAAITSTTNPRQTWGDWTFIGSNGAASDLNLGSGLVKIGATRTVTVQNADTTLTVGGAISDSGAGHGLTKAGPGTLALSGTSTYTGPTNINDGTLRVDGSIAASSMTTVNTGGALSGSGTVGALTLSGGTVSPGGSVGTLPAGNTAWTDTSSYLFEIDDAAGTAGVSPGWDLLDVTGTLDLAALSAGGFTVDIDTLLLGGGTNPGDMANFDDGIDYSWEFVRTSGGVNLFEEGDFLLDVSGVMNPFTGTFGISQLDNSLYVTYTVVATVIPEPSTLAIWALGLLGLAWYARRRKR